MKIKQKMDNIQFVGVSEATQFTVANSSMMMEILSTNIYQDAILAAIRETATNAYDAHVEANNASTPFDIHLPTVLEPYYSIRDYGTGLSKENMKGLYTTTAIVTGKRS